MNGRIRTQLLGSFGTILVLLTVVTGFAMSRLNAANAAMHTLSSQMDAVVVALDAEAALTALERDSRQAFLVTSNADNTAAKAAYDADDRRFTTDVEQLNVLISTPEGAAKLATINQAYARWRPIRDQAMALGLQNRADEGQATLSSDPSRTAQAALNSAMDDLVQ